MLNYKDKEVVELEIDCIQASPLNTFEAYPKYEMDLLRNSIRQQGLLEPIIVRPGSCCESYSIVKDYEILSGHNRYTACRDLGIRYIRCVVLDADDVTASLTIAQANIQRPVSEIEIARNCKQTYDLMKFGYGGDRRSEEFKRKRAGFHDENPVAAGDRTMKELAMMYGISQSRLYRRLRITELADEVLDKYLKGKLTQEQAVQISYADKDMQLKLLEYYSSSDRKWITEEKALAFGKAARMRGGKITPNEIQKIMESAGTGTETPAKSKVRRYPVPSRCFPPCMKVRDRPEYIAKALDYIRNSGVNLDS